MHGNLYIVEALIVEYFKLCKQLQLNCYTMQFDAVTKITSHCPVAPPMFLLSHYTFKFNMAHNFYSVLFKMRSMVTSFLV